jgi:hypothetical protein
VAACFRAAMLGAPRQKRSREAQFQNHDSAAREHGGGERMGALRADSQKSGNGFSKNVAIQR